MSSRIAVFNEFEQIVAGLTALLAPFADLDVVPGPVGTLAPAPTASAPDGSRPYDVALIDTYGQPGLPWGLLGEVQASELASATALFTFAFDRELVDEAVARGVQGYLWKGLSPRELAEALRRIARGQAVVTMPERHSRVPAAAYRWPFDARGLTARESEVLALLAEGHPNAVIAQHLYVST
jgi:two-component system, NarL family, response regulator LiaR